MSLKQRIKILLYDFVKVCPPARRMVRHMLFQYREITFRRHTKGIATDPNLMVFCTFSGRGYSDSPRAIFEYMANRPEEYGQYRYVWIFQHPERFRWLEEQYPNTTVLQWPVCPIKEPWRRQSIGCSIIGSATTFGRRKTRSIWNVGTGRP